MISIRLMNDKKLLYFMTGELEDHIDISEYQKFSPLITDVTVYFRIGEKIEIYKEKHPIKIKDNFFKFKTFKFFLKDMRELAI